MKCQLVVPSAGMGLRLGRGGPKALVDLAGRPLLVRTLEAFQEFNLLEDGIIVVSPGQREVFEETVRPYLGHANLKWVEGGESRQESVGRGLSEISDATDIVLIHDAARPFISRQCVDAVLAAAREHGAATLAVRCSDTIFEGDGDDDLVKTLDRSALWSGQTPQAFRTALIKKAHLAAQEEGFSATDDATLVRRTGAEVKIVEGTSMNFKITTAADLELAARRIGAATECSELV